MTAARPRVLRIVAFVAVLAAILWAGLSPFERSRPNDVRWDAEGGLRFAGRGVAWLDTELQWPAGAEARALTLAFWIRTDPLAPPGVPVAIDDGLDPPLLEVGQHRKRIHLAWRERAGAGRPRTRYLGRTDAFLPGSEHFVAIVSGRTGTRVFVDGEAPESVTSVSPLIGIGEDFAGTLVIGSAGDGRNAWQGTLRSLAIFEQALDAQALLDVARALHARDSSGLRATAEPGALVVYLPLVTTSQGAGRFPNLGAAGGELRVPARFAAASPRVLGRYWSPGARDVALNFLGFVPLGALVALGRGTPRRASATRTGPAAARSAVAAILLATLIAAALSLGIELLQVDMLGRDSSLYDWLLNTAGAGAGAAAIALRGAGTRGRLAAS